MHRVVYTGSLRLVCMYSVYVSCFSLLFAAIGVAAEVVIGIESEGIAFKVVSICMNRDTICYLYI